MNETRRLYALTDDELDTLRCRLYTRSGDGGECVGCGSYSMEPHSKDCTEVARVERAKASLRRVGPTVEEAVEAVSGQRLAEDGWHCSTCDGNTDDGHLHGCSETERVESLQYDVRISLLAMGEASE